MAIEKGVDEETLDKALDLRAMARGSDTSESLVRFAAGRGLANDGIEGSGDRSMRIAR